MNFPVAQRPFFAGLAALLLLYAAAGGRYHDQNFLSPEVALGLFSDNAPLGLCAVGVALVLLAGSLDLSVGAVMGCTTIIIATLIEKLHLHPVAAVSLAVFAATINGAMMGAIIHFARLPAFIVTLAGLFIARGGAYLISLESIAIRDSGYKAIAAWAMPMGAALRIPLESLLLVGATSAAWAFLRYTRAGRYVYALGDNPEACIARGLPVARTRITVHALSGLCAGLGGFALTLTLPAGTHTEGVGMELDAIAGCVIGGILLRGGAGNIWGALIGTLVLGLIVLAVATFETRQLTSGSTKVIIAGLLLGFVVLQRLMVGRTVQQTSHSPE